MNNFKKILCLLMSLTMLIGCFALPTSALADGKEIGVTLVADKETAKAGDVITYTLYVEVGTGVNLSTSALWVSYNTNVFETATQANLNRTYLGDFANFYAAGSVGTFPTATAYNRGLATVLTEEEKAIYNHAFQLQLTPDVNLGTQADGIAITSKNTAQMSFQLTVKAGVADGTALPVAILASSFGLSRGPSSITVANGTSAPAAIAVDSIDLSTAATSVTVGSAASIIKPLKGQMRYGATEGTYDVRALAVITGADFDATFVDIATAKSRITEIGFVFAAGENVTAPSMDAVKNVVKNYADKEGDGTYVKKTISQISTAIQPGDYVFSCIVPGVSNEDAQKNSLVAVGYILYTDADGNAKEAYYPAAQTIEFADYYKA